MSGLFGGGRKDNSGAMMQQMQQSNMQMVASFQKSQQEMMQQMQTQNQQFMQMQLDSQAEMKKQGMSNRKPSGAYFGAGGSMLNSNPGSMRQRFLQAA